MIKTTFFCLSALTISLAWTANNCNAQIIQAQLIENQGCDSSGQNCGCQSDQSCSQTPFENAETGDLIGCGCGSCLSGDYSRCPRPLRRNGKLCNCPDCGHAFDVPQEWCQLKVSESTESRTCYQTEQKTICIPAIQFPWQKCCPPKCGKSRTITVLKTHSFKCPICKYTWEVQKPEPCISCKTHGGSANGNPASIDPPVTAINSQAVPVINDASKRSSHSLPSYVWGTKEIR